MNSEQELASIWQSEGSPIEASSMMKAIEKNRRRQRGRVAVELIASAAVIFFWLWQLAHQTTPAIVVMAISSFLVLAIWLLRIFRQYRKVNDAILKTFDKHQEVLEEQRLFDMKLISMNRQLAAVMALAFVVALPFLYQMDNYRDHPEKLAIASIIVLLIVVGTFLHHGWWKKANQGR